MLRLKSQRRFDERDEVLPRLPLKKKRIFIKPKNAISSEEGKGVEDKKEERTARS
jgi:hypothetical protein